MDELIVKLADVYERKAFAELLKMILQMVQEILMYRIFHGKTDEMKCCDSGHLRENGNFEYRIRISLGEFKMIFWHVSCVPAAARVFRHYSALSAWGIIKRKQTN